MNRDSYTDRPISELLSNNQFKVKYDENMNYMQPLRRPESSYFVPVYEKRISQIPEVINVGEEKATVMKGSSAYNAIKYLEQEGDTPRTSFPLPKSNRLSNATKTSTNTTNTTVTTYKSKNRNSAASVMPPSSTTCPKLGIITIHERIGKGGYSTCYLGRSASNHIYAVKSISKKTAKPATLVQARHECKVHEQLHHPSIVKYEDKYESPENIFIFLQYCPNRTLQDLLKKHGPFSDVESCHYLFYILGAVQYLHSQQINHGDIKLSNILLDHNMHPKLADFGFAKQFISPEEKRTSLCGTVSYMAPEIIQKPCRFGLPADIWSLGVAAYTLIYGKTPFDAEDAEHVIERILDYDLIIPNFRPDVSIFATNFILKCLVTDPEIRPNINQVMDSSWFKQHFADSESESELETTVTNPVDTVDPVEAQHHKLVTRFKGRFSNAKHRMAKKLLNKT